MVQLTTMNQNQLHEVYDAVQFAIFIQQPIYYNAQLQNEPSAQLTACLSPPKRLCFQRD